MCSMQRQLKDTIQLSWHLTEDITVIINGSIAMASSMHTPIHSLENHVKDAQPITPRKMPILVQNLKTAKFGPKLIE